MTLRLLERLKTQLTADAHGVMDGLEERGLLLKQHLREAELELLQKRGRVEALGREEERLVAQLERLDGRLAALDEDIELALAGAKQDHSRFSVRKLLPVRREREASASALGEVRAARGQLAECLETQEQELEALRTRARSELARASAQERTDAEPPAPLVADEEVELELLRRTGGAS